MQRMLCMVSVGGSLMLQEAACRLCILLWHAACWGKRPVLTLQAQLGWLYVGWLHGRRSATDASQLKAQASAAHGKPLASQTRHMR